MPNSIETTNFPLRWRGLSGRMLDWLARSLGHRKFTTQEAPFQGSHIEINARTTRGGEVDVELREHGKALEGFSFADCVPFNGDAV